MSNTSAKVQVFSLAKGAKPLLTATAPSKFDKKRIAEDAREVDALLRALSERDPYRNADWQDTWDDATGLSFYLRRYGLDVTIAVNISIAEAAPEDQWGTEDLYRTEEREERRERAEQKKRDRQRTKKIAA